MNEISDDEIVYAQALYSFSGQNNDELCFGKGDLIVITKKEDGGWWEGTLNENTGWFPSNYVRECNLSDSLDIDSPPISPQQSQQQIVYRLMVIKEIIESEKSHIAELKNCHSKFLLPLQNSAVLSMNDWNQLTGNSSFEEIISLHENLLHNLEEQSNILPKDQKIGGTFLYLAPDLASIHKTYISRHPKAVAVLEKFKEEISSFLEKNGAPKPGFLTLTTGLSSPFRRLEKYSALLREFQRHLEDSHIDRGDTQRSIHVFKELSATCTTIRRQKELELEVVSNKVMGWDGGESLGVLGEVILMKSVALLPDLRDRYLVLFPSSIVVLALSSRASSFIFEGKYNLNCVTVNKIDDSQHKNAFEITVKSSDKLKHITAICQTVSDQLQWIQSIQDAQKNADRSLSPSKNSLCINLSNSETLIEAPNSHASPRKAAKNKLWSGSCLRPTPPMRPNFVSKDDRRSALNKPKKKEESWNEDDALILKVIEGYCLSSKSRYTIQSGVSDNFEAIRTGRVKSGENLANDNKYNNQKALYDLVYSLRDDVRNLNENYEKLKNAFENEHKLMENIKKK